MPGQLQPGGRSVAVSLLLLGGTLVAGGPGVPALSSTPAPSNAEQGDHPRVPAALEATGDYAPAFSTSDFVVIDNPYLPLEPGTTFIYEGDGERIETAVTDETRQVMGVPTRVVHDQVFEDGQLVEDTYDWYAQDRFGNVWYLGEDSREMKDGQVLSTAGSWEAGVDGALPGIVMLGDPRVGDTYRQEYLAGEAEDVARVVAIRARRKAPRAGNEQAARSVGRLVTDEWTALEPGILERKTYARGVGLIEERVIEGGSGGTRLVEVRRDG